MSSAAGRHGGVMQPVQAAAVDAASSAIRGSSGGGGSIWDYQENQLHQWLKKDASAAFPDGLSSQLIKNLLVTLNSLREEEIPEEKEEATPDRMMSSSTDAATTKPRPPKRRKKASPKRRVVDPYHIWWTAVWKQDKDDPKAFEAARHETTRLLEQDAETVPSLIGGKLAQLCERGMLHALAAVPGGLTLHPHLESDEVIQQENARLPIPSRSQLQSVAAALYRTVAARVRADILRTTPSRICELVAPDLSLAEIAGIRRRIYDTVVVGNNKSARMAQEEEENAHLATAQRHGVHEIERFKKCQSCGNVDQASFVLDRKNGDVICSNCGTVVSESITHEGTQFRKFEGEADRNHNGDAANPLYSNAYNMGTTLSGMSGNMGGGFGSGMGQGGGKRNLETILRNAHAYTELNVSQFGKTDRRTRTGYKDKQKKDAFLNMNHVGDALSLHEAVVQRAKEIFAGFRDDRELVQQYKGVIAACLCEAFDQLSQQGKAILKQEQQEAAQGGTTSNGGRSSKGPDPHAQPKKPLNSRAARRAELHHANLAGKGGLLIDFSAVPDKKTEAAAAANGSSNNGGSPKTAAAAGAGSGKAPAAWDLEDCRSWLLDASRRIAQQWVESNKLGGKKDSKIPTGSLEELEGRLVEHSIALCEYLEKELKSRSGGGKAGAAGAASRRRVVTPRVNDMSKLGIKWQHAHERGSGGKGGVGGSGNAKAAGSTRTAGQILILLTAKKLGSILKDAVAGDAIHKELRTVVAQEETRKRQALSEEASRKRLQQMKRKPWLQARVQG